MQVRKVELGHATALLLFLFSMSVFLAGCGTGAPEFPDAEAMAELPINSDSSAKTSNQGVDTSGVISPTQSEAASQRKVIYDGEMELMVEDLKSTAKLLREAVVSAGGYISDQSMNRMNLEQPYGKWKVRIPVNTFQDFLERIEGMGQVQQQTINAEEVTDQFVDLQSRLINETKLESRILDLFDKSSNNMKEIITLENELARVRKVVEQIEGRLRYLSNRTDLATVTISMHQRQEEVAVASADYQTRLSETWDRMVANTTERLQNFLLGLIVWLPMLVVGTIVSLVLFFIRKRISKYLLDSKQSVAS